MSSSKVPKHYSRLPGTSMGYKFDCSIITTNNNPGPGTYQLPALNIRSPIGTKFGNSARFDLPLKTYTSQKDDSIYTPMLTDPGALHSSESVPNRHANRLITKSNSSTFGKADRPAFFPKDSFPQLGPGAYEIKDNAYLGGISKRNQSQVFNSRKFTYFKTDSDIPGPGSYEVNSSIRSIKIAPGTGFSKSKKDYLDINILAKNSPNGSSYYSTAMTPLSKSVRGVSFGKQKKETLVTKDDHPGPGSYQVRDKITFSKSPMNKSTFGIARKFEGNKYFGSDPGPGDYSPQDNVSLNTTRRGISFTKSLTNHFAFAFSSLPGPGNYELPDTFTLKKIEIEKKLKLVKERIEEKKRANELKALKPFMDETKGILIKNDSAASSKVYVSKEDLDSSPTKHYRDTVFEEFVCQSSSPGPKYMIKGDISRQLGKRGTKFFLGKEKEKGYIEELVRKKIPGPGAYQFENYVAKKLPVSFAASKREEDIFVSKFKKTIPGVGLYEQKLEKKATGGSFGKAIKPTSISKPEKKKFLRLESKLSNLDDNLDANWDA